MKFINLKKRQLAIVFVIALTISLVSGIITPISTQNLPLSMECQQLKDKIQMRARDDAKSDRLGILGKYTKKKGTLDINNLYGEENKKYSCFLADELYNHYEKEYENNIYPLWIPISVIIVFLTIIINVISENIKNGIQIFFEFLGKQIYQKLAGTPFLRNLAVKKYRKALIEKYEELHIAFRANRPLKMREIYVSLKVKGTRDESLIEAEKALEEYSKLMVIGVPGSGKSVLLRYLTLSYAEKGLSRLPTPFIPILLELNKLSQSDLDIKSLEKKIIEICSENNFPKADNFVEQNLKNGHLSLLFDGLDEVTDDARSQVVKVLKDFLNTYPKCQVIITCRTAVYNKEFYETVNQTLEIVEFNDRQIRRFLKAWESEMPPDKSVQQLLKTLENRPQIKTLAQNPLLLTIIAYLYTDTPRILPHSRAEFYTEAIEILLKTRDEAKNLPNKYKGSEKQRILEHLALYLQTRKDSQTNRRLLSDTEIIQEIKQILPDLNLNTDDVNKILDEIIDRSGLLSRVSGGKRYQFAHQTLQEYFVASVLTNQPEKLIEYWEKDPNDWREILKLWCGLGNSSTSLIETVYERDPLMAFECLADTINVYDNLTQEIISYFKGKLADENNEEILTAFGSVATDSRPESRGQRVFQFLTETLANGSSLAHQEGAAIALSETNRNQAAEFLAQYYDNNDLHQTIRRCLVKLGNLAIPSLLSLLETSHQSYQVLEDLKNIQTPEVAIAVVPLLFHSKLANLTAWYLGFLLQLPEIEEALNLENNLITEEQKKADYLDWIWSPFDASNSSNLSFITGRIAYLLVNQLKSNHSNLDDLVSIFQIDSRIMIPICAITDVEKVKLPKKISDDAIALLEQSESTEYIKEQMNREVDKILGNANNNRPQWTKFLLNLPSPLQLDLLRRLIDSRRHPTINNWRNLDDNVDYQFLKSGHYWGILIFAVLLSIGTIFEIIIFLSKNIDNPSVFWIGIISPFIFTFLTVLWTEVRSTENSLDSPLLISLGFFGIWTFIKESARFCRKTIVWKGIIALYDSILVVYDVVYDVGIVVGIVVGYSISVGYGVGYGVVFVVVFVVGVGYGVGIAFGIAFGVLLGVVVVVGVLVDVVVGVDVGVLVDVVVGVVFVVGVGVGAGVGVGLAIWYKGTQESLGNIRWLSILAFPWFCWFPSVLGVITLGLRDNFSLEWAFIISFWSITLGLCAFWWRRGETLEAKARNPFKGILTKISCAKEQT